MKTLKKVQSKCLILVFYFQNLIELFKKLQYTKNPPARNTLVWDGECGFCNFWKTRWEQKTKDRISFETYQQSSAKFPDIPLKEFKKASRLIETDGKIYSGPDSAYRSIWHSGTKFWHNCYSQNKIFRSFSDHAYNHIAKNRRFYWKLTMAFFGDNPEKLKPYWLAYLAILTLILILL